MKKRIVQGLVLASLTLMSTPSFALLGLDLNAKGSAKASQSVVGEIVSVNAASNTVIVRDQATGAGREIRVSDAAGFNAGDHVKAQANANASTYTITRI